MAREMDIATSTLRTYVKNILSKLGTHSRLQAAGGRGPGGPPERRPSGGVAALHFGPETCDFLYLA